MSSPLECTPQNNSDHTDQAWLARRALFVTGPHASGKSHIVHHAFPDGFSIFDLGPIIRQAHQTQAPEQGFGEWLTAKEAIHGPHFTNDLLVNTLAPTLSDNPPSQGTILIGNRSMTGISYLRDNLDFSAAKVIYLSAPKPVLYERYKQREGRENLTEPDFEAILQAELAMGLGDVQAQADHIFENACPVIATVANLRAVVGNWALVSTDITFPEAASRQ